MKIGDKVIYSPCAKAIPNLNSSWRRRVGKTGTVINDDPYSGRATVIFEGEEQSFKVFYDRLKLKRKCGHHLTNIFK